MQLMTEEQIAKANPREFYRQMHKIADKMAPLVRRQFLDAVKRIKSTASKDDILRAVEMESPAAVETALSVDGWGQYWRDGIVFPLRTVFVDVAGAAAAALSAQTPVDTVLRFDLLNPRAVEFIRRYEFSLIEGIQRKSREGIRRVILNAFEYGGHPYEQAKEIVNFIGLTDRQAMALDNYREMLDDEGQSQGFINRAVKAYQERLLDSRAKSIARTETIRASSLGQQALWEQAEERGLLDRTKTRREWIVTPDDRLCSTCAAIPDLNEGGVGLDEPFQLPDDADETHVMEPPAHPNCRCATALVFDKD